MRKAFLLTAALLFCACVKQGTEQINPPVGQSSLSPESVSSAASSSADAQSESTAEEWKYYTDSENGFSFGYPARTGDAANWDCTGVSVPLIVVKNGDHLTLTQEYYLEKDCVTHVQPTNAELIASGAPDNQTAGSRLDIWATKVKDEKALLAFAQKRYGKTCRFDAERVMDYDAGKKLFLTTDSQTIEDTMSCNDSFILYRKDTGTAFTFFMPLKTAVTFTTPDHQGSSDGGIAAGFRFLPSTDQ